MPRFAPRQLAGLALMMMAGSGSIAMAAELKLERVLLSTGGVGYFDYSAAVPSSATLELVVPKTQTDDILKSLTIYDAAGLIGAVTLPGEAASSDLFRDLPISEVQLAKPSALLEALRGAQIRVDGPKAVAGRVMAVVPEETVTPEGRTVRHRVSVLTDEGLRTFVLEEAQGIRFEDPEIATALQTGLARLASAREPGERRIEVRLEGPADREVRLGYLVEAPLWKTSYRVTLASERARLQAWAVVDNRSGVDWRDVELTLVAGSPVTLRQALAKSYFVERQEVPIRLFESVRPRTDRGAVPPAPAQTAEASRRAVAPRAMAAAPGAAAEMMMAAPAPPPPAGFTEAAIGEAQTQTVFHLASRVSVPNGGMAMVPLADRELPAERIALYQPDRHATRPLAAVRLTNETGVSLPPGILTIYERDAESQVAFVGDAELALLPAGETRLVPYALDGKTRILSTVEPGQHVAGFKAQDGVLVLDIVEQSTMRYTIEAPAGEPRTLVLEQPKLPGYELVSPKAAAETERFWRIERKLAAGVTERVEVVQERAIRRELALVDLDLDDARLAFAGRKLPPALETALQQLARLRAEVAAAEQRQRQLEDEQRSLAKDQERLRANLGAVPKDSDLAKRYLVQLGSSEDRLEALTGEIRKARREVEEREAALERAVREIKV